MTTLKSMAKFTLVVDKMESVFDIFKMAISSEHNYLGILDGCHILLGAVCFLGNHDATDAFLVASAGSVQKGNKMPTWQEVMSVMKHVYDTFRKDTFQFPSKSLIRWITLERRFCKLRHLVAWKGSLSQVHEDFNSSVFIRFPNLSSIPFTRVDPQFCPKKKSAGGRATKNSNKGRKRKSSPTPSPSKTVKKGKRSKSNLKNSKERVESEAESNGKKGPNQSNPKEVSEEEKKNGSSANNDNVPGPSAPTNDFVQNLGQAGIDANKLSGGDVSTDEGQKNGDVIVGDGFAQLQQKQGVGEEATVVGVSGDCGLVGVSEECTLAADVNSPQEGNLSEADSSPEIVEYPELMNNE